MDRPRGAFAERLAQCGHSASQSFADRHSGIDQPEGSCCHLIRMNGNQHHAFENLRQGELRHLKTKATNDELLALRFWRGLDEVLSMIALPGMEVDAQIRSIGFALKVVLV